MRNYATQMDAAKRGIVTPEIETVAKKENRPVEFIMERVARVRLRFRRTSITKACPQRRSATAPA